MGGGGGLYKSVGQIVWNMAQKGHTTSSLPKINLVVPDVKVLRNEIGQFRLFLRIPWRHVEQHKLFKDIIADWSCKICIDGKK